LTELQEQRGSNSALAKISLSLCRCSAPVYTVGGQRSWLSVWNTSCIYNLRGVLDEQTGKKNKTKV